MNNIVNIYTDGACRGNPGKGGWGALLVYQDSKKELYGFSNDTTNNIMELTAVIESLKSLKRKCPLIITTDSEFEKFLLAGFMILLYLQILINIATVVGLIPLTGYPFPLLSLGGSSIIAVSSIFGIINRIFIENNQVI